MSAEVEEALVDDGPYLNRELSWLAFNGRVLALAEDPGTPLLERVKFLAIFSQNLDEFFQVRVAGLKDRIAAGVSRRSADGRTATEQLEAVLRTARDLAARADEIFLGPVCSGLADSGMRFSTWAQLDEDDRKWLTDEFHRRIFPVLTPLAVDPGHQPLGAERRAHHQHEGVRREELLPVAEQSRALIDDAYAKATTPLGKMTYIWPRSQGR